MPSYPTSLTITNPGAETGTATGWTNVTGTLAVRSSGTGGQASHSGGFFFIAGASATTECRQDIALDSSLNSDIDANKLKITFSGWHAGVASADNDAGALALEFYDGSSVIIGGRRQYPSTHDGSTWVQRKLVTLIPPNTRTVRLIMLGTRVTGTNLDSYWDDLDATIDLAGTAYGVYGCNTWLVGSAITDGNGVAMSQWNDSSGNAFHVTASGTARPLSRPSGNVHLNSKPTAEASNADGAYDQMKNAEAGIFKGNTGFTVISVVNYGLTGGTGAGDIIGRDTTGNRGWRLSINDSTGVAFFQVSSSSSARTQRDGTAFNCRGTPYVVSARYNGGTGEQSIWINGNLDNGSIDAAVPSTVGGIGPDLGVFSCGGAEFFSGHIAEILVFGRALTDTEKQTIESQLLDKYHLYRFVETALSPSLSDQQGVATDGTYYYMTGTGSARIRKLDSSWTQVALNSSPFSGIGATIDHLADCEYYSGSVYAPAANSAGPPWNSHILVFDASTLSRTSYHDVSAETFEYAALAIDTNRSRIWVGSYQNDDQLKLWWYDLSTFAYGGSLTVSEELTLLQGLTYNPVEDSLWASLNDERICRIDPTTGTVRQVYQRNYVSGGESEGIDFRTGTALYWTTLTGGGTKNVHTLGLAPLYTPAGVVYPAVGQLIICAL